MQFCYWWGGWGPQPLNSVYGHVFVGTILCAAYIYVSFNTELNIFKGLTSRIYLGHRPFLDAIICLPINMGLISFFYYIGLLIPKKWFR